MATVETTPTSHEASSNSSSSNGKRRPLPRLFYTSVHDRNINSVKLLMETVLPVRYGPDFYKKLVQAPQDFTKMAYFEDIFVGCIGGRVEGDAVKKLYIMVLGVLAPYRERGVGSELLKQVLESVKQHPDIKEIYMHVWTENDEAVQFYQHHGFERGEELKGYYRGISPPDCVILRKAVNL